MNHRFLTLAAMTLAALGWGACGSSGTATVSPQSRLAQSRLASALEIPIEDLNLAQAEQREWSDSCLGLGGPAESCLAAITPGWRFEFELDGRVYEVRTDRDGRTIRSPHISAASPGPPGEQPED